MADTDMALRAEVSQLALVLAEQVRHAFNEAVQEHDLTRTQVGAMRALRVAGSAPQRELAATLGCDASNMTGVIDRLESRGLVHRAVDPRDRRIKRAELTPDGTELVDRVWDEASRRTPVGRLSTTQLRQLRELLNLLVIEPTPTTETS